LDSRAIHEAVDRLNDGNELRHAVGTGDERTQRYDDEEPHLVMQSIDLGERVQFVKTGRFMALMTCWVCAGRAIASAAA
jgi:hypothetical protein